MLLWPVGAPFAAWAVVSMLLGLGFTFFSGAVEAWLVDALTATGFTGDLESVFGRGQIVAGAAMLTGTVGGGAIAQFTSLGVPFVLRAVVLAAMFVVAFRLMHDVGFTPASRGRPLAAMRTIAAASIDHGWRVPAVKWLMVESLFTGGIAIYGFYALQPYLLELYGDPQAYLIAGLSAAIVGASQMLGGVTAPWVRRLFRQRATALIAIAAASTLTIVWAQPVLGRAADAWGYAPSYAISAGISVLGLPFLALSRRACRDRSAQTRGTEPIAEREALWSDVRP